MQLTVHQAYDFDNYKDIIRIHKSRRGQIHSGHLVRVSVRDGKSTIAAVRGLDPGEEDWIRLDLAMRRRLGVELGGPYDFTVRRANPWEALQWATKATDPAARIATWIAIWSGIIGTLLGVLGLFK